MKRYRCASFIEDGSLLEAMERSDDGDWVRYEDVSALLKACEMVADIADIAVSLKDAIAKATEDERR